MQRLHLLPSKKVAEELLLIDSSALRKILPEELVDEAWVGKQRVSCSNFKALSTTVNVSINYGLTCGRTLVYHSVML